jgi:hypothetical protein
LLGAVAEPVFATPARALATSREYVIGRAGTMEAGNVYLIGEEAALSWPEPPLS